MQHSNKRKILVTLLISSGLLTACNQAGNSTASANSPQHAVINNAAETQKFLRVVNHIDSTIDHINIISESGQVVFKSTTGLNCTNNQNCNVDINGLVTAKNMLAKFYNNKNQMISMAMLQNNSQKLMYSTVYTNNTIFGAQLFKKLVNVSKTNNQILLQQLTKFFKNNDQQVNVLTELGAYYSQQLAKGVIHNENDFYRILLSNLSAGKTIVGKLFLLAAPQKLQTGLLGCDNETGNKVFDTITPFAKLIPAFGETFEGLSTEAQAIFNWACTADTVDFAAEFDQINEKLDTIQASLDALTDNVQELRDMVNNQALGAEQVALNNLYNQEDVFNNVYVNYMTQINAKQSDSDRFKSVHQYVNFRGGLDKISQTSKPLFAEADGIIGGLSNQYETMQKLNNQLPYLTTLLNAQCSDANKISGDIIAKRNYCNAITMQVGMKIAAYAHMSRLRMSDAILTVDTSAFPEDYLNPFGNGKGITWAESLKKVKQDFKIEMESVNAFYKKTLIMPTTGLPEQLVTSLSLNNNYLKSLKCNQTTPSGVYGIVEWYVNKNGNLLSDNDKYIVTSCYQDSALTKLIQSSYYYGADGASVTNVLGVLVGKDSEKEFGFAGLNSNYTDNNAFSAGPAGINTKELPGLEISGEPYLFRDEIRSPFIPINSNFVYNVSSVNDHWKYGCNSGEGVSPTSISWPTYGKSYYYLKVSGNNTLDFNIPVPTTWPGARGAEICLTSNTVTPFYWPVTDNNGNPVGEAVVFGFRNVARVTRNKPGYNDGVGNTMGLQCLSSKCSSDHGGGNSVLRLKLKNGKSVDIWFGWDDGKLTIHKNVFN
jgi:hypothetical protein